jgi:propanediol dehydratase small subunit
LRLQAQVAREAGRPKLAENFERAAEMVAIPAEAIFEIYEKLRPGRARDAGELQAIASRLRIEHGAERLAVLIEEAAGVYEARGLFGVRFG